MYLLSKKELLENKDLTVQQLIDQLEEKSKKADSLMLELMNVNTNKNLKVGEKLKIPFYNRKTKTYVIKTLQITNQKDTSVHLTSEMWYELDNFIWVSRFHLNMLKHHMKKGEHKDASNTLLKCNTKLLLSTIYDLLDPNHVIKDYNVRTELGIQPTTFLESSYGSIRLLSMWKVIKREFFYDDFDLNKYVQDNKPTQEQIENAAN